MIDRPAGEKPDRAAQARLREGDAVRPALPGGAGLDPRGFSRLISQLEGSFAKGDLAGLVSLFTANAVVNGGVGAAAVRKAYLDLLTQPGQRRMTVVGVQWRSAPDQRILGHGTLRIGTRAGAQARWRDRSGPIDLELVPWMGDYKISRLVHSLPLN